MSLINEALKKAQRQRTEDASAAGDPGAPSSGRVVKRGQAMRAQTVILIATGAAILVVFSVVLTVMLVNRDPAPKTAVTIATPKPVSHVEESPALVAPTITLPSAKPVATTTADDSSPDPARPAPESGAVRATERSGSVPVAAPVEPATAPGQDSVALPAIPQPDRRVQEFVDAIRVAGIRSSGDESKVLMNDRVHRVNDVVERTLGVKLIKVESDRLTFADANGITYVKSF